MLDTTRPEPIRAPLLDRLAPMIRHGFFTRAGGVSQGLYQGLNVGVGSNDDREHVAENRRRVAQRLGTEPARLLTLHQVHSADAVVVREPVTGDRPKADAMVTDRPGLALGVLTADCGPILFADAEARVVAAAHAGWKGALSGIIEATVQTMERLGAHRERIAAVLGPAISVANYEVGPEFVERFVSTDEGNQHFFRPSRRPGHAYFDLTAYTMQRLSDAGLTTGHVDTCTYADESRFFSYRRATHRGEPDYGRQISAIMLEDR